MPICVAVLKEIQEATQLAKKVSENFTEPIRIQLIKPKGPNIPSISESHEKPELRSNSFPLIDIDNVKLLNPKLSQSIRQKTMAFWLMPFGFIAGLTFTKMTGLQTFSRFGFDPIAEPLIGSFLGMGSGWIGSYVASASLNTDKNDDITNLRKLNNQGLSLLLLETPLEIDLPWELLKQSLPVQIMSLNDS